MKLTNIHNLPEPFVAAVSADEYERGDADYTCTELIKPVRILALTRKHWNDIEEDVSDRVWAFQGQTKHIVLERIARLDPARYLVEERFEWTMPGGKKISGKIDLYDKKDNTLFDWKETSVWKFLLGDTEEWEQQSNVNLFLMRMNHIHPEKLINVALLKDFKKRMARTTKRKDYPSCAIHLTPLPIWTVAQAQDFILKRIKSHEGGAAAPPVCTKKERWQRDHEYALMKRGKKNAVRKLSDLDQAEAIASSSGPEYYVEERKAEPVRCLDFCSCQPWCDFGIAARKHWES